MEFNIVVQNKSGIHARPASVFVQTAKKYQSDITVIKGTQKVNAKSILGVLSLGITQGTEITVSAEGIDEQEAAQSLKQLILEKFGEE